MTDENGPKSPEHEDPILTEARRAQTDPWVMYLVVRSDLERTPAQVLVAAARATVRCADELAGSDAHREAFAAWSARSFRKVSVRAKAKQWERLLREYPGACDEGAGEGFVRALVPRRRSENDGFLRALQVYTRADPWPADADAIGEPAEHAMAFVANPAVPMSLGKAVAQIGHAVLMSAWSPYARSTASASTAYERWRIAGYPVSILASRPERWREARAQEGSVVVRDAGITEVVPGSETVCATPPGASRAAQRE
jgi:peptidyl-tRNA hydrolase